METLNGAIKFLSIDNMAGFNLSTDVLWTIIMSIIAIIALGIFVCVKFINKDNRFYVKYLSGGKIVSKTKVVQICSIVVLIVSLIVIAFTWIKPSNNENFSVDDFIVTGNLKNNNVSYSQSNLVNNSDDYINVQSIALSKEADVDDNNTIWTIKNGDKTLFSGPATGEYFPVQDFVIPSKDKASLTLTAQDLNTDKINNLAKSNSEISFSIIFENDWDKYTVNHWKLDINDQRPETPSETETLVGQIGTLTNVLPMDYDSYTAQVFSQDTIKADGTTVIDIDYKLNLKSLDIDGFHYFPVVTKFTGAKFYKDVGVEIKPEKDTGYEMSDLKDAHYYLGDAPFKAVRSFVTTYISIYGANKPVGANPVLPSFISAYLKQGESVEKLQENFPIDKYANPKINNVELKTIWRTYNPMREESGFGGSGSFWSCVASEPAPSDLPSHPGFAWMWHSTLERYEETNRDLPRYIHVCISRQF